MGCARNPAATLHALFEPISRSVYVVPKPIDELASDNLRSHLCVLYVQIFVDSPFVCEYIEFENNAWLVQEKMRLHLCA